MQQNISASSRGKTFLFKAFWSRRFNILLIFFAAVALFQPHCKCKLEDQINNTNSEPEFLEIAIEPCNFCSSDLMPCWETPGIISANVMIEVRTASKDALGNVIPDAAPYSEIDLDRDNMSCSATSPNNKFLVSVPKKGAYFIRIDIKSLTCSYCCYGTVIPDIQCGAPNPTPVPGTNKSEYDAGKPKWNVEEIFIEGQNKPIAIGGNTAKWTPTISDYQSRKCSCGCKVIR